jgi:hypothetical protein
VLPLDEKNQPLGADRRTLEQILWASNQRAPEKPIEMGGFTKWFEKYSNTVDGEAGDGGALEAVNSKLYTSYNVVWSPDANFSYANASIYRLYPGKPKYVNKNRVPMQAAAAVKPLENKRYILLYEGDYDSASWLSRSIPTMFNDPRHGDMPMMWPIIPINDRRAAHVYEYMYENMADTDVMVGGNNGLGYVYWKNFFSPTADLPGTPNGGCDQYVAVTKKMNDKYDLDVMGCYFGDENYNDVNMDAEIRTKLFDAFAYLYPSGVGLLSGPARTYLYKGAVFSGIDPGNGTPSSIGVNMMYLAGNQEFRTDDRDPFNNISILQRTPDNMNSEGTAPRYPSFIIPRSVLCTPTNVIGKIEKLMRDYPEYQYEVVDPYTFYTLYKQYRDKVQAGDYRPYIQPVNAGV